MSNIQLDYSDITDIFKEKLKIDNIVKKISSIFLNPRYAGKINYKPYFQRNYVWDEEKATYFIESILLGTEIPPLVLFQTRDKNEVIDGRQRYETIERFLNDKLILKEKGLHSLKILTGKKYSQLDEDTRELFEETRIRILQFNIVDEPKLDEEKEDKIKKEIFRRYNSGITPLLKYDMDRATYITDEFSNLLYNTIFTDEVLFSFLCKTILPKSKSKAKKRDKVNILVSLVRNLITLSFVPIYSYSKGSSKAEIICQYYYNNVANKDVKNELNKFHRVIEYLNKFYLYCEEQNPILHNSKLFYEVLYWGIDIVLQNGMEITDEKIEEVFQYIKDAEYCPKTWKNIINNPQRNVEMVFEATGSHYYSAINNRYNFIANIFEQIFKIDFQKYMKDKDAFKEIMARGSENEQIKHYKINKPLPETLTIEDVISDMKKSRFLIRPEYQRSEVKNIQKASYLMESILLGINIPPIFVYKRGDKIKEVVDGQQRLLTILGFLGRTYIDERGENVCSDKDRFKLSKLKILSELNGKTIDNIESTFEERILEFPMDVIEIDYEQNPDFSQIDLFLRLNTKPYPIKENTFEMWNAYVDKEIVTKVKGLASKYEKKVFRAKDNRMKLEELITSLAYLDYRMRQPHTEIINVLNIYKRNDRMCARIMSKDNVTKTLSELSNRSPEVFVKSLKNVEEFIDKILILIDNDSSKIRELFSHSRKGTQYKTDQNYYFLWAILFNISIAKVKAKRNKVLAHISKLFMIIQKTPSDCTVESFLQMLNGMNKI